MNNPLKEKLYLLLLMNVSEKIDINKKKALFSSKSVINNKDPDI